MVGNHDIWEKTECSEDDARQTVKSMVDDATSKSPGGTPGHLTDAIEDLNKPIINWKELLRTYTGRHCGCQRRTYSRTNRRRQTFGSKGVSRHAAATLTVVVDTSGSMSREALKQIFSEIEAMSGNWLVSVIQSDSQVQGEIRKYRRGDWAHIDIQGRGGTDIDVPFEYMIENGAVGDCVIALTDGYVPRWPDEKGFPVVWILTSEDSSEPDWGHVVRVPM